MEGLRVSNYTEHPLCHVSALNCCHWQCYPCVNRRVDACAFCPHLMQANADGQPAAAAAGPVTACAVCSPAAHCCCSFKQRKQQSAAAVAAVARRARAGGLLGAAQGLPVRQRGIQPEACRAPAEAGRAGPAARWCALCQVVVPCLPPLPNVHACWRMPLQPMTCVPALLNPVQASCHTPGSHCSSCWTAWRS